MDWRGARIVITGGAGFIGSHLADALVARGSSVVIVDDFSAARAENLREAAGRVQVIRHRLGTGQGLPPDAREGDILLHLAAVSDPRTCREHFDTAWEANVAATYAVLASWRTAGRVVCLSSAAVYGDPDYVPIDEGHPLNGGDPYAVTKIMAEYLCRHFQRNEGRHITIARNFNAYGPRQGPGFLIPSLIRRARELGRVELWNGSPVRDFVYIDDVVEALLAIAASAALDGGIVNLGSGDGVRVGDVAAAAGDLLGLPVADLGREVTGSARLICDNSRLRSLTGWRPTVSLVEGLRRTIAAPDQDAPSQLP